MYYYSGWKRGFVVERSTKKGCYISGGFEMSDTTSSIKDFFYCEMLANSKRGCRIPMSYHKQLIMSKRG